MKKAVVMKMMNFTVCGEPGVTYKTIPLSLLLLQPRDIGAYPVLHSGQERHITPGYTSQGFLVIICDYNLVRISIRYQRYQFTTKD
jgi:hypothetical protein